MAVEALKKAYLFSGLRDEDLEVIDAIAAEQPIQAGDRLIEVGSVNDAMWILLSGSLVVRDSLPGGLEVDLFRLKSGDLFGEMSFTDNLPASASVIADSKGKVLKVPFQELRKIMKSNPELHVSVLEKLAFTFSQRLRAANQQIGKGFLASLGIVQ